MGWEDAFTLAQVDALVLADGAERYPEECLDMTLDAEEATLCRSWE